MFYYLAKSTYSVLKRVLQRGRRQFGKEIPFVGERILVTVMVFFSRKSLRLGSMADKKMTVY